MPFAVPLVADSVLGPRLAYGSMPVGSVGDERPLDVLLFPMEDDSIGRVTFEGLDAIRAARGELLPYERQEVPNTQGEWVYLIEGSAWLEERHRYELGHYETPLLDRYDHYLFSFHDEFVEAIALGIWFDKPAPSALLSRPAEHPLLDLPESAIEERSTSFEIDWEMRVNPRETSELVEDSYLCSQRLLQYNNLVLDGTSREHASVWLRIRRGRSVSTFVTGFFGRDRQTANGIADPQTFADRWLSSVEAVASRRRDMGAAVAQAKSRQRNRGGSYPGPVREVHQIDFRVDAEESPEWPSVTVLVDGEDVIGRATGFKGFDPDDLFAADGALLPRDPPRRVAVYRCSCGEPGCGCAACQISEHDGAIVWRDFRDVVGVYWKPTVEPDPTGGSRHPVPDLTFDATQYRQEVDRATADRSWETRRRLARLLRTARWPARTRWSAAATPSDGSRPSGTESTGSPSRRVPNGQVVLRLDADFALPDETVVEQLASTVLDGSERQWNVLHRSHWSPDDR